MLKKYRREHTKIWKQRHGKIPRDKDGRSYEIHHLDGNPENNNIDNLICVSIQEHYNIHKSQGDYGAAFLIANRMKEKPSDIAEVARQGSLKRLREGTHNFQDPNFPRSLDHNKEKVVAKDLRNKKIIRVSKEEFDSKEYLVGHNYGRTQEKVHNNRGHNKGKKWRQQNKEVPAHICKYCGFTGRGSLVSRWHNDNCKYKENYIGSKTS